MCLLFLCICTSFAHIVKFLTVEIMSKHSIELDRTTYFRILKDCVDKSGKALTGNEIGEIFEKHIKKEYQKFDVGAIRQELNHNGIGVRVKDEF